jgi:hypothetical protein
MKFLIYAFLFYSLIYWIGVVEHYPILANPRNVSDLVKSKTKNDIFFKIKIQEKSILFIADENFQIEFENFIFTPAKKSKAIEDLKNLDLIKEGEFYVELNKKNGPLGGINYTEIKSIKTPIEFFFYKYLIPPLLWILYPIGLALGIIGLFSSLLESKEIKKKESAEDAAA